MIRLRNNIQDTYHVYISYKFFFFSFRKPFKIPKKHHRILPLILRPVRVTALTFWSILLILNELLSMFEIKIHSLWTWYHCLVNSTNPTQSFGKKGLTASGSFFFCAFLGLIPGCLSVIFMLNPLHFNYLQICTVSIMCVRSVFFLVSLSFIFCFFEAIGVLWFLTTIYLTHFWLV